MSDPDLSANKHLRLREVKCLFQGHTATRHRSMKGEAPGIAERLRTDSGACLLLLNGALSRSGAATSKPSPSPGADSCAPQRKQPAPSHSPWGACARGSLSAGRWCALVRGTIFLELVSSKDGGGGKLCQEAGRCRGKTQAPCPTWAHTVALPLAM